MQLKWGTYSFDANTNLIGKTVEVMWNEGGQPYKERRRMDVQGFLTGSGQAALTTAENALIAALQVQNQSLTLYQDGGTTESALLLSPTNSITGVRIVRGPDFTSTQGPEYATERKFSFTAEAEYPVSTFTLLSFTETLSFGGGGPQRDVFPALEGPPVSFLIYAQTPYEASQSGQATGWLDYPAIMAPIWPAFLKVAPKVTRGNPKRNGLVYTDFPVSWSYEFKSASPLVGIPNRWIE